MRTCLILIAALFLLGGCATTKEMLGAAQVSKEGRIRQFPATSPVMVYVSDFDLEVASIKGDERSKHRHRLLGRLLHHKRYDDDDPAVLARKLVDMMSTAIVDNLNSKGVPARRVYDGEAFPTSGWMLRGVFTEVDQGDIMRRTVIGFGSGATHMQLCLNVSDLSEKELKPFYSFDTDKSSGSMPGAVISFNPYMAAAGFMMNKKSMEKDVKGTAAKIAEQIAEQIKVINEKHGVRAAR